MLLIIATVLSLYGNGRAIELDAFQLYDVMLITAINSLIIIIVGVSVALYDSDKVTNSISVYLVHRAPAPEKVRVH